MRRRTRCPSRPTSARCSRESLGFRRLRRADGRSSTRIANSSSSSSTQIFADKVSGAGRLRRRRKIRRRRGSGAARSPTTAPAKRSPRVSPNSASPSRAELLARLTGVWNSSRYAGLAERKPASASTSSRSARSKRAQSIEPAERRGDTIARLFDLLEAVSRRGAYLALLTEYPAALDRVLSVLGGSRWAAGYLIRHPQLLDELLDDEAIASPFDWPEFKRSLRVRLAAADGVEQQMDLLRHAHQAEVFRILLIDLAGKLSVEHVSDRLSELADAVLDVTHRSRLEAVSEAPSRGAALRGDRVREAGRQGTGLRVGPRSDLSLRRSRRRRVRRLCDVHAPA